MCLIAFRLTFCRLFLALIILTQVGLGINRAEAVEAVAGKVISVIIDQEGWNMTVKLHGFKKQGKYFLIRFHHVVP